MHLERPTLWPVSLLVACSLLIVWQQPGTIALRNMLGGVLLLLVTIQYGDLWKQACIAASRHPVTKVLIVLTVWLLLGCALGGAPSLSFREFFGQWGVGIVFGLLGASLGFFAASQQRYRQLLLMIVGVMGLQVLLHDVLDIWATFSTGHPPFRAAPLLNAREIFLTGSPPWTIEKFMIGGYGDLFSYVNNTLAAFIIADLAQRVLLHRPWLPLSIFAILALLAAVTICSYFLQYRNGNIGLLVLLLTSALFILVKIRGRIGLAKTAFGLGVLIVGMSVIGTLMIHSDPRWKRFAESVVVALQTENSTSWITHETPPEVPSGGPAEVSAYERISWIYEGAKLIQQNPLGTGYNRNAWGDTLHANFLKQGVDYKTLPGSHSHSGIIDFTIAAGIPGMLIWFLLIGCLISNGIRAFNHGNVAPGLVLVFVVTGFFGRSLVDSNMRDHMLQQFFFLSGLLVVLANRSNQTEQIQLEVLQG